MKLVMMMMLANGWRLPHGGERARRDKCLKVDSNFCLRASELEQISMTCGKLSNQTPSVQSRLDGSSYSSACNCWDKRVD